MNSYIIGEAFIWLFAIVGFVEIINKVGDMIFIQGKSEIEELMIFVKVKNEEGRLEYIIRAIDRKLDGIETKRGKGEIFIIDKDLEGENYEIAASLSEDYDNIFLCKKGEIIKMFEEI